MTLQKLPMCCRRDGWKFVCSFILSEIADKFNITIIINKKCRYLYCTIMRKELQEMRQKILKNKALNDGFMPASLHISVF